MGGWASAGGWNGGVGHRATRRTAPHALHAGRAYRLLLLVTAACGRQKTRNGGRAWAAIEGCLGEALVWVPHVGPPPCPAWHARRGCPKPLPVSTVATPLRRTRSMESTFSPCSPSSPCSTPFLPPSSWKVGAPQWLGCGFPTRPPSAWVGAWDGFSSDGLEGMDRRAWPAGACDPCGRHPGPALEGGRGRCCAGTAAPTQLRPCRARRPNPAPFPGTVGFKGGVYQWGPMWHTAIATIGKTEFYKLMLSAGLFYHLYNQVRRGGGGGQSCLSCGMEPPGNEPWCGGFVVGRIGESHARTPSMADWDKRRGAFFSPSCNPTPLLPCRRPTWFWTRASPQ